MSSLKYFYLGLLLIVVFSGCATHDDEGDSLPLLKGEEAISNNGSSSQFAIVDSIASSSIRSDTSGITKHSEQVDTTPFRKTIQPRTPLMRGSTEDAPKIKTISKVATDAASSSTKPVDKPFQFNLKDTTFLIFTADTVMNTEESYDVFLSIYTDPRDSSKALKYVDMKDSKIDRIDDTLFYLPDYKVTLHGTGFHIAQITDSIQHLYKHSVTTWNWQVVPEKGGTMRLTVVVAGFNAAAGASAPKDHFFIRQIKVKVKGFQLVKQFALSNYGYAAYTSLLAGLGLYIQNRRKKKKLTSDESSE